MGVTAIVQARMGSSRLPGKSLRNLAGKPVVMHVVDRALATPNINTVAVATSINREDDCLAEMLSSQGIKVCRGDESDVLSRYAAAAREVGGDPIVRLTGDDPLKDPEVMAGVINAFLQEPDRFDYVSNTIRPTFPEGQDTEVIRVSCLFEAERLAVKSYDREHVTPFFYNHPEKYRCLNVSHGEDLSYMRWTLDNEQDLRFFEAVLARLDDTLPSMQQVLTLLKQQPDLMKINQSAHRSDRYLRSSGQVQQ